MPIDICKICNELHNPKLTCLQAWLNQGKDKKWQDQDNPEDQKR